MTGLIDFDGKITNLALMKLSTYYKALGESVELAKLGRKYDRIFCSVLFTWNKNKAAELVEKYPNIEFGGTGWNLEKTLPDEIEACKPDYDLYTIEDILSRLKGGISTKAHKFKKAEEIVKAGIGFTTRGCIRQCGFCFVPPKEGKLHQVAEIKDIINPRSNVIILLDNNITADPDCIDKLHEIRDRGLIVDITQGIDIRLMTPEIAQALSEVKYLRSIHYAWDLMAFEHQILDGIKLLKQYIKPWKHMCFMLTGYNTLTTEDMYRFKKLQELDIDPYVMPYNKIYPTEYHRHFARWVNGRIYKACEFEEYAPWVKSRELNYILS